ncbi:MAG TPA: putative sugar nucleotidyl transferase [Ferruginibacter sp.]|nr:putative sugar nucleotidyl transferase [Ferruginibacter sp.]HRO17204.1 putative sugar nucleotidyl transferase [Ferruginibacter sp.]HRQ19791.1 putative sugar nucleotidyl transferase [Ferruginibacter sp.]
MAIILTDKENKKGLIPFTHTQHAADIRIGIFTIREKWEMLTGEKVEIGEDGISTAFIPCMEDYIQIRTGTSITDDIRKLHYPWQIFQFNEWAIRRDFDWIINNRRSAPISSTNRCVHEKAIFIEPGAKVEHVYINAEQGPVYIGAGAEVMEGAMLRGPVAICEGAVVKMGATVYGGTTIGKHCVASGEIKNAVLMDYSNKAHDGYLGDSVVGRWCNIGAGSSNSNLKNNAADVVYDLPHLESPVNVGKKAGLIMGDYCRAAINTSFNTGSFIGVCCNIFDRSFPDKIIPDFSWGNTKYEFVKALEDIRNWMSMKGKTLTVAEEHILQELYYKTFEK